MIRGAFGYLRQSHGPEVWLIVFVLMSCYNKNEGRPSLLCLISCFINLCLWCRSPSWTRCSCIARSTANKDLIYCHTRPYHPKVQSIPLEIIYCCSVFISTNVAHRCLTFWLYTFPRNTWNNLLRTCGVRIWWCGRGGIMQWGPKQWLTESTKVQVLSSCWPFVEVQH